ncbi:hypothetical protein CEXT_760981 [Caerostris extrusa]|uniref:Uncharacterized protein n=1 Tax=Caerostris extrusa TaxID=172846 RepID=A0AAV4Q1I2_CAEEX|nr:hypothetical protein CEXT_760981 [Caerostris extrusa]
MLLARAHANHVLGRAAFAPKPPNCGKQKQEASRMARFEDARQVMNRTRLKQGGTESRSRTAHPKHDRHGSSEHHPSRTEHLRP